MGFLERRFWFYPNYYPNPLILFKKGSSYKTATSLNPFSICFISCCFVFGRT